MMRILNLTKTPRAVGNPRQTIVYRKEGIDDFIKMNNGRRPCFISTYPYLFIKNGAPVLIEVDKVFQDFDDAKNLSSAISDSLKFIAFCDEEHLPYLTNFSGKKGFHNFLGLKSKRYRANSPSLDNDLASKLRSVQMWLKLELGLGTSDERIFGDYKRLMRIPYTKHNSTRYHCCPIPKKILMGRDVDRIKSFALSPKLIKLDYSGRRWHDLDSFIKEYDVDVMKYSEFDSRNVDTINYEVKGNNGLTGLLKRLIPLKCLHNSLLSKHPNHFTRFSTVIWLRDLGYSEEGCFNLLCKVGWRDFSAQITKNQIRQIYVHQPKYGFPSCERIMREGICVGSDCKKYKSCKVVCRR